MAFTGKSSHANHLGDVAMAFHRNDFMTPILHIFWKYHMIQYIDSLIVQSNIRAFTCIRAWNILKALIFCDHNW